MIGKLIGKYKINRLIGEGGYSYDFNKNVNGRD
jgi:hypothetical protein